MNIPAALISSGIGAAFFAAGYTFYIQPPSFVANYALPEMLAPNHARARAAVIRLLLNPASAQFDLLKTVDVDAAKYVCGNVNAKDQSGAYAGNHAFVYTVAVDFARIDDNGRISQKHAAYKACPVSDDEEAVQQKMAISPGALAAAKAIQKTIPASDDPAALSKMASRMPASAKVSSGGSMQQQLGQLAGDSIPEGRDGGMSGRSSGGTSDTKMADNTNESEWRSDRPPAAWPNFPPGHPLATPTGIRSPAEAIALARAVEDRWEESKSGNPRLRPSSDEIKEACRGLLTIDPKSDQFPKAWGAFVRLRKIDREVGRS